MEKIPGKVKGHYLSTNQKNPRKREKAKVVKEAKKSGTQPGGEGRNAKTVSRGDGKERRRAALSNIDRGEPSSQSRDGKGRKKKKPTDRKKGDKYRQ